MTEKHDIANSSYKPRILRKGAVIRHKTYGNGIVETINSSYVMVRFPEHGCKRFETKWFRANCTVEE